MASDSESEDEDSQIVRFNVQEITELQTCLEKIINIILPFFKKNTKYRKELKIIKKDKKAKGKVDASNEIRKLCSTIKAVVLSEVSAARSLEVVTGTAKIHTPAAVGASKSHTEAIPGPSRTHTEAIPGTSRHDTEPEVIKKTNSQTPAVLETLRSDTDAVAGTSRSHTGSVTVTKKSNSQTTATLATPRSDTDAVVECSRSHTGAVLGATRSNTETIAGTSTSHTEAIPGTSKNHIEPAATKKTNSQTTAVGTTPRCDTDAVTGTFKSDPGVDPGTTGSNRETIPGTSTSHSEPAVSKRTNSQTIAVGTTPRSDTGAVAGTSRSDTGIVPGTTRSNRETIPGTSTSHTEPAVIKKTNSQTIAVLATPGSDTGAVAETSISHTSADPVGTTSNTEAIPETFRDRTEPAVTKKTNSQTTAVVTTPRSDTDAVAGTSRSDTGVVHETTRSNREIIPGTSKSHTEARVTETLHRNKTKEVPGTTIRHTVPTVTKKSNHNHTKEVPGTTISHTVPTATKTSNHNHTKEVPGITISHTEARVTETLHRNQTKEVPGTTISHTVPTVTTTSNRNHTKEVPGTTISHTVPTVTTTSNRNHTKEVPGTTISHTVPTVTTTSNRNHTKKVPGTTITHTVPTVTTTTSNRNQTKEDHGTTIDLTEAAATETSKNETKRVQFINSKQKSFTNSVSITPKSHTKLEAAAASKMHTKLQNPETSQTLNPTNTTVISKPIVAETPRGKTEAVSQTPRNRTETVGTRISSSPTKPMGTGTKKSRTQSVPGISHTDPVVTPRHSCNTHTEAAAGTSRNNTVAVAATSRSRTEATTGISRRHTDTSGGTSGSHTESIPGTPPRTHTGPTSETSRSHKETIPGISKTAEASFTKSHTKNKNFEISVRRIEALDPSNFLGHTKPSGAETAKGHTKSIVRRNSSVHIEPVPGTSRNNPEAVSSSRSAPGTVLPETTRNPTKSNSEQQISGIPKSPAATGVSEIIKNHIEPVIPGTSKKPTEVKLSRNSKNHKNVAVSGTLRADSQITKNFNVNIRDDLTQKASTNLQARNETKAKTSKSDEINANISAKKRHDEKKIKRNHANSNHDDPKRPRLDNKCSIKKPIYYDKIEQNSKHHKIQHNKENYEHKTQDKRQDHGKTHEPQNGRVADKKSADGHKRTATRSESTPNGHIEQTSLNSPRTKTTDEITQKQAHAKKITASRSESTPDERIEQGTSNSALTKMTDREIAQKQANMKKRTAVEQASLTIAKNVRKKFKSKTEEFTLTKIAEAEKAKRSGDDKRKRAQNETYRPETTPKRLIEQAITNSTLAKKPRTDKYIKSVEANERKTTGIDTGPNADIERAGPNSTLAKIARNNKEKKPADAKKKMATKSDSALNGSKEETIASSTLKKRDSTKADYCHEAKFYTSIDLTSDNDDELKPPTTAVKVASSKPVKDDKKMKDTCFSDVTEESNEISNAIKEPSPKPADHHQLLIDEPAINIDKDTCLYDPAEEKGNVTIKNSGPKSTYDEQILLEEPVVDLTYDLDDVSEQKTSVAIKESSSNTAADDVILNHKQGINGIQSEGARSSTTNPTESNKTINKYRTKLLEELETKRAEDLLAENVKNENTNQTQLDSDTVVISNFFHPSSSNQNTNQGIITFITTEQTPAQITQRQDKSKKRNDKIAHKSKKPNEKPKNNANQPNPNVVLPDVTISTKVPGESLSTCSTTVVQSTQKANQNNSAETRNFNTPVITPELSITIRSAPIIQGSPKLAITSSAYPALIQQSIPQTPRPNVSITTSAAASEYRTPVIESRPVKPNPVTKASKRPSSDLEPSPRATKPREQNTNPIGINAQSSPLEWVPSITLVSQPRHGSGNTESSTNHSNDVTCQPIPLKPVSTSHETPSPQPHVGSTARVDLNSNRGENESSPVQTPQTHWRRPVPLDIPTSNQGTSRWQNSNLRSEALSNRSPTQLNDSQPPRPTWHTPVPAENERPDLSQVSLGVHPSPNLTTDQPSTPHSLLNPVQPANQRIPIAQVFAPSNLPLRPVLLIPRHQSTMIDYQRAPTATRPTWHIPTLPTDF